MRDAAIFTDWPRYSPTGDDILAIFIGHLYYRTYQYYCPALCTTLDSHRCSKERELTRLLNGRKLSCSMLTPWGDRPSALGAVRTDTIREQQLKWAKCVKLLVTNECYCKLCTEMGLCTAVAPDPARTDWYTTYWIAIQPQVDMDICWAYAVEIFGPQHNLQNTLATENQTKLCAHCYCWVLEVQLMMFSGARSTKQVCKWLHFSLDLTIVADDIMPSILSTSPFQPLLCCPSKFLHR